MLRRMNICRDYCQRYKDCDHGDRTNVKIKILLDHVDVDLNAQKTDGLVIAVENDLIAVKHLTVFKRITDKKTALLITVLSLVLGIAALVLSHLLFPFSIFAILDMSQGIGPYLIRTAVLLAGMIAYIVLHELTHAAVMKYYGATKLRFGFSLMYAYAGSERDYF